MAQPSSTPSLASSQTVTDGGYYCRIAEFKDSLLESSEHIDQHAFGDAFPEYSLDTETSQQ